MEGKDVLLRDFNNTYIFPRAYKDNKGNIISDGLASSLDKSKWDSASSWVTSNGTNVVNHIGNSDIHVTATEKENYNEHIIDTNIHVTAQEKTEWIKFNDIYPVGGIYISSNNIDPSTIFTGTSWTSIGSTTVGSTTIYYWQRSA